MSLIAHFNHVLLAALIIAPTSAFADRAPPPTPFKLDGHRLILPSFSFKTNTATLSETSEVPLNLIADYLAQKDYISLLRIEAHVTGSDAQALSEQRAMAVVRALVRRGVDCKRLLPVGFGDSKPIADPTTPEGRAQNPRIEAINAALRGRPIGGMPIDGGGRVAGDPCIAP